MAVSEKELMEIELKVKNGIKLTKDEKQILKENSAEEKAKKKTMSFGQRMKMASKSEYSQLMGDNEEDNFPIRDFISTGNVLFNAQISSRYDKGLPSGRVTMFCGSASTGKTFLALETAKNAQKLGYFVVLYDSEMANNDKEALKARGIDTEQLLYIPIDTVENLKTSLLNILEEVSSSDNVIVVIDSIGNLSTNKEVEDSIEGSATKDMTRPAQLKALFRTVTIKAGVKNVPIIAINHTYAQIGGFMSGGQVQAGGSGPQYNASIIAEFTKAQEKGSDGKTTVGSLITSTVTKCRTAKERTKVKFTIDFEEGLTLYSGLEQFCLDENLIQKEKRSFVFTPKTNFKQGETFSTITDDIWDSFLREYLGSYLQNKFAYTSVFEDLGLDNSEDDD